MRRFQNIRVTLATFGCFAMLFAGAAKLPAGELDPSTVPADAKWLVHIDYERLSDSKLMKQLREEYSDVARMAQQWFQKRYGFDPRTELYAVTMFSRNYEPQDGTVIVRADYSTEKVLNKLEKNESLETTSWRDHTLRTVTLAKRRGEGHHEKSAAKKERRMTTASIRSR